MSIEIDREVIIFSIGNPGPSNRHSTGHIVLKSLIDYFDAKQLVKPLAKSRYSMTEIDNIRFVKSNNYMNESNKLFKQFIEQEKVRLSLSVIIMLYDEFDSDLGKVKISTIKKNESHNGIKSIKNYLNLQPTLVVYKLGIGIGPKPSNATKDTMASWVLSNFKTEEKSTLEKRSIPLAIDYIDHFIQLNGEISDCNKLNSYFTKQQNLQA